MKKLFLLLATVFICFACNNPKSVVTVTVSNPLAMERSGEMVEVDMSDISNQLKLADTAQIVVLNVDGEQVPYQLTYNEKVIFPVTVAANGTATYTIQAGTPETFTVKTCGKHYPERVDDVAWENDLVAFRAYGPALQKTGERAFGYDVWTKYNTSEPVVEARYAGELNPETKAKIAELRKTDPKAARELYQSVSYHVDHGNGLDCYKVGPTLGGGTAALMPDGEIVYPYCYATQNILDNGPLRFTVKLVYNPLNIKGDSTVIESRVVTLDAGSHLNKTVVTYENLKENTPVATGIVLHEPDGAVVADAANGYITYVDPTDNVDNNNGKIFIGAAFPAAVKEAKSLLFSEEEKVKERGGADGHLLAISDYEPGSEYVYYWGSAWDKADIKTPEAWNEYMAGYAQKVRNPLAVTIK
ncbi:DUF4861 domain-containing protein [Bacteroides sp. UBA939]|uniref:DUF4861 domain-containing protein n=1 Tax=Bacteroides sp. UBA939 TaxID=1946092 RepID=UPI0025B7AF43|nr:DUF4861 domain-containing protein [Bacteroides sp. UBA939]